MVLKMILGDNILFTIFTATTNQILDKWLESQAIIPCTLKWKLIVPQFYVMKDKINHG